MAAGPYGRRMANLRTALYGPPRPRRTRAARAAKNKYKRWTKSVGTKSAWKSFRSWKPKGKSRSGGNRNTGEMGTSRKVFGSKKRANFDTRVKLASAAPETFLASGQNQTSGTVGAQAWGQQMWQQGYLSPNSDGTDIYTQWNALHGGAPTGKSDVFVNEMSSSKCIFSNASTGVTDLYIYDVKCIKDITGLETGWYTPLSAFDTGIVEEGMVGGGYTTEARTVIGCLPTQFRRFNQNYKIVGMKKVVLNPGQVHTHTTYNKGSKKIPMNILSPATGEKLFCVAGTTYGVMWRAVGYPANDATTPTLVNIANTKVNMVWEHKNITRLVTSFTRSSHIITNTLNPKNALPAGARVINDDAGTIGTISTA